MRMRVWRAMAAVLAIVALLVGVGALGGCKQEAVIQSLPGDVTNLSGLHVAMPTAAGTSTPALLVNQAGLGKVVEFSDGGTPVYSVSDGGAVSQSGAQTINNYVAIVAPTAVATGNPALLVSHAGVSQVASFQDGGVESLGIINGGGVIIAGPTAIATAMPALEVDSLGVSKILSVRDGNTEVLGVNNGGQIAVAVPTALATAVPAVVIDSAAVANSFEVRKAATPVFQVDVDGNVIAVGDVDLGNSVITNIGAAGTDFSGTGGLTLADALVVTSGGATITAGGVTITAGGLDMTNDAILNIGAAGTDFSASGGLTLADDLNMSNEPILNIGAAGTDFSTAGGLTLAQELDVTAGGITVTAGGLVVTAGGIDVTNDPILNIGAAGTDFSATGGLTLADDLDMSNEPIVNVGAAGTDFSASGGLTLADALVMTGGAAIFSHNDDTVADGATIVPTTTVLSLDTSGAVTITLGITDCVEGQILVLINDDANATIIADTNLASSTGSAITLTDADDIAVFILQDSVWHELLLIADS